MQNYNAEEIKFTNPESAAKAGEKWYTEEVADLQTHETKYVSRPIFVVKSKDSTYSVNSAYLYKFFEFSEKYITLRNSAVDDKLRYIYSDGAYRSVGAEDILFILKQYVENFKISLLKVGCLNEALQLIDCGKKGLKHNAMNRDEGIINFQNGLLDLKTMELLPHSSDVLSSVQIPCAWTSSASPTPVFDSFLSTLTSGDEDTQRLLLEYMGAVISNIYGYRFKKSLYLLGKGNTGKSRLSVLLTQILGEDNAAWGDPKSLHERFGTTSLYMKRLLFGNDLSYQDINEMDIFKMITGGDPVPVEYKNKNTFV